MERLCLMFSGRVQGVGFRVTTRAVARGFAVSGWVRNEPEGSVRCEVQGGREECLRFLAALCDRMDRHIESVGTEPMPTVPGETGFVIRR